MNLSIPDKFNLMRAFIVLAIVSIAILCLTIYIVDIDNADFTATGSTEVNWQDATDTCTQHGEGWTLPSIFQLAAIHYRHESTALTKGTDYWSRNSFNGFAFGLNTGSGIASFDKHSDTDHYLCIKQ